MNYPFTLQRGWSPNLLKLTENYQTYKTIIDPGSQRVVAERPQVASAKARGKKRGKTHERLELLGFTLTFDWPTRWHDFFQPIKKVATLHHNTSRNWTRQRKEHGKPCATSVAMILFEKKKLSKLHLPHSNFYFLFLAVVWCEDWGRCYPPRAITSSLIWIILHIILNRKITK